MKIGVWLECGSAGGVVEGRSVRWRVRVWAFGWWDEAWSVGRQSLGRWGGAKGVVGECASGC